MLKSPIVKRLLMASAVVILTLVGVGVVGQIRRAHREAAAQQAAEQRAAAHSPLQAAAASIDRDRRVGHVSHFALVPATLPPGLVQMEAIGDPGDDGVTDVYAYGLVKAVVKFTAVQDRRPCGDQPCVRDSALAVTTPDAPSLNHVAVWLTGTPSRDDPGVRRFWAETTWVPIAKASWFTELAAQGESS